jgi:hypothetical protein
MHENLPLPPDEPPKSGLSPTKDLLGSVRPIPIVDIPQAEPTAKENPAKMIWQKYGHILIAFVIAALLVGGTIIYLSYQNPSNTPFRRVEVPPVQENANKPPEMVSPTPPPPQLSPTSKSKASTTRKKRVRKAKPKPKPWLSK